MPAHAARPSGQRQQRVFLQCGQWQRRDGAQAAAGSSPARQQQLQPGIDRLQQRRESLQSMNGMLAEAVRAQKGALTRLEAELNAVTLEHVKLDQAARQGAARLSFIQAEQQRMQEEQQQPSWKSKKANCWVKKPP
jgi:chromosome segregation protein